MPEARQAEKKEEQAVASQSQDELTALQKKIVEYEQQAQDWQAGKKRLDGYDNWYRRHVEPHWGSPEEFQKDLAGRLIPMKAQGKAFPTKRAAGPAQRNGPQRAVNPMSATPRRTMPPPSQRMGAMADLLEGLADDEWLTAAQARKALTKLSQGRFTEADFNRLTQQVQGQFATQLHQWLTQQFQEFQKHLYNEGLPKAFSLYDSTRDLRDSHKDDPDFKIDRVIQTMTEKGLVDPHLAYKEVYGERDLQRSLEKARQEGEQKAREQFEQETKARNVTVLSGNGGFFPKVAGNEPAKTADEAMAEAAKEITQTYGNRIW